VAAALRSGRGVRFSLMRAALPASRRRK
jgi:hypothetical protein